MPCRLQFDCAARESSGTHFGGDGKRFSLPMNRPTPTPSKEGSRTVDARWQFPSYEGLGVGSGAQIAALCGPWNLSLRERAGVRERALINTQPFI